MFAAAKTGRSSKCYFTSGELQEHFDPSHLPEKKPPFSVFHSHRFNHGVDIIMPKNLHESIGSQLSEQTKRLSWHRLRMPLGSLLEGDFFNRFIKTGNILVISEGHPTSDDVFSLCEGILKLSLCKVSFERSGLVGGTRGPPKSNRDKSRWVVELDLRAPSMVHGRKGFERIVYACKNVFTEPLNWLFCDLNQNEADESLLTPYEPLKRSLKPQYEETVELKVPNLRGLHALSSLAPLDAEDVAMEMYEWLSLAAIDSPRIEENDEINAYLSRYAIPLGEGEKTPETSKLVKIKFHGLIPSKWISELFVSAIMNSRNTSPSDAWFSLTTYSLPGDSDSLPATTTSLYLRNSNGERNTYHLWEAHEG